MQKKVSAAAKKVVTKSVAKKVSTAAKKMNAKKAIVYADNASSFWVNDGRILNSLLALSEAMATMEKGVFAHHVGKKKHDFADWVESVLCDKECALDLRKAKNPKTAMATITKHLKSYQL